MRYPAAEKLEIILVVERSHLPVRRTLAKIGIPPTTFYRWYDRFVEHGPEGLEDRPSSPSRVWNRIPEAVRDQILNLALEEPELSPRELAVKFTDRCAYQGFRPPYGSSLPGKCCLPTHRAHLWRWSIDRNGGDRVIW